MLDICESYVYIYIHYFIYRPLPPLMFTTYMCSHVIDLVFLTSVDHGRPFVKTKKLVTYLVAGSRKYWTSFQTPPSGRMRLKGCLGWFKGHHDFFSQKLVSRPSPQNMTISLLTGRMIFIDVRGKYPKSWPYFRLVNDYNWSRSMVAMVPCRLL